MRKTRVTLALLPLVAAATVLAPASPALAATCNPHCYGIARMTRATHGGTTNLRVTCLGVSNVNTQFVTQEFWVHTGASSSNTWVEQGMTIGTPRSARSWFWADSRPGSGGYHEHYPSHSASLNTTYIMTISYAGSNSWNVYEHGGSPLGVSTANNSSSPFVTVGEEITDTTAQGAAVHSSLYYKDTADAFHQGWPGAVISGHNPPTAQWISTNNSMRAYSNCSAPSVSSAAQEQVDPLDISTAAARDVGRRLGGGALPTSVSYVRATAGGSPVVVVTMTGRFGKAGTVLTTTHDATTGRLLSSRITNSTAGLTGGTVVYERTAQVTAETLSSVLEAARQLAAQNGEPAPQDLRYVQSTRAAATGGLTDTDPSVVVVTMSGRFVGHAAKVPPGGRLPTGKFLTAVYDAGTGELTDWSITPQAPELR